MTWWPCRGEAVGDPVDQQLGAAGGRVAEVTAGEEDDPARMWRRRRDGGADAGRREPAAAGRARAGAWVLQLVSGCGTGVGRRYVSCGACCSGARSGVRRCGAVLADCAGVWGDVRRLWAGCAAGGVDSFRPAVRCGYSPAVTISGADLELTLHHIVRVPGDSAVSAGAAARTTRTAPAAGQHDPPHSGRRSAASRPTSPQPAAVLLRQLAPAHAGSPG